jgi:hypothetical protein
MLVVSSLPLQFEQNTRPNGFDAPHLRQISICSPSCYVLPVGVDALFLLEEDDPESFFDESAPDDAGRASFFCPLL